MHNTKVYVSSLPKDFTEQQFLDFMQKCGVVLKDPETGKHKIKLYKDSDGNFKGDALCTYVKVCNCAYNNYFCIKNSCNHYEITKLVMFLLRVVN